MTRRTFLGAAIVVAASAAIAGGFMVAGSPEEARMLRLDHRRVSDLQRIQGAVDVSFTRSKAMPDSIAAAMSTQAGGQPPLDPGTGQAYEYRVLGGQSFEVCAVFDRASDAGGYDLAWAHAAGRQCFPLTARDLSKPPG